MEIDSDTSDEELVLLVQKGQGHDAFAQLVNRHTNYLYRVAWRTYPDAGEAEDIVQEVFLKFWKHPQSYDATKGASFTTWLTRVTINRSIDSYRKKKPIIDYEYLLQQPLEGDDIPLEQLERNVQKIELERAIQHLPMQQKNALDLCFYEQMKQKDAAKVMDISVKALESHLMRAKRALRGLLNNKQGDLL